MRGIREAGTDDARRRESSTDSRNGSKTRLSVDVADDHHVHHADLDRRDQLSPNPARVISLNPENPSSLKVAAAVQPRRFAWSVLPLDLGGDRLGRVVGLAQTAYTPGPELGFAQSA
jgi:hypothetical protein